MTVSMEISETQSETPSEPKANNAQEFSTDLLKVYYGRLFPYEAMFKWFSYGNDPNKDSEANVKDFFARREWSFTIEDDIYIRYQSFRDKEEFMTAIQKRQPHKIDIGAVFTAPPKDHHTIKPELFKTVERELVFDIDMTDYDDIRTCCSGAEICMRCWPYMTMAVKVVDRALREDFGFGHILWVYSGRRGVHCWVCDSEARALSNEARAAVVEYLSVHTGSSENSDKKLKSVFTHRHPLIEKSYDLLEPYFSKCIADGKGQGLLAKKEKYMKILNVMPDDDIRKELYEAWEKDPALTGSQRWKQIVLITTSPADRGLANPKKRKAVNYNELTAWRYELVFTHCYPRLDANVSKAQNHLLKSPFCVHPKTGRVCVPINPAAADSFSPFTVPTVRTLCEEIDQFDKMPADEKKDPNDSSDINKTSMREAIKTFEDCFMNGMWTSIRQSYRQRMDEVAAMKVDF